MANVIKTVITLRRGTTAEWSANKDVIPAAGEPCFDLELNELRIGNGVDTYENLKPIGGATFDIAVDGKSVVIENKTFQLMGFDAAAVGAIPQKNADGNLEWVLPSVIMKDLENKVSGLTDDVALLETAVDGLKEIVDALGEGSAPLLDRIEALEAQAETVDTRINKKFDEFDKYITSDGGKIDTLMELIGYVEGHGAETTQILAGIDKLEKLVGETPVDDRISAAVAGKVDAVEGKVLSSNDFTDSLLSKLESIEENAQVNIIEKLNVGGTILDVVDKTVEIPVAGLDRAGVVKSSTGANKVHVSNSGEMSVNKINIHSVFVPMDEELILDGGRASKNMPVYPTRVGNIGYNNISDAVNYADNGDVVTLQEDVNMGTGDNNHLVVNAENVTIDLGGKTLTSNGSNGVIKVEGGMTTLDGPGVVSGTLGSDKYSMAVWCDNGTVVINDGTYKNETDSSARGTDLIYASGTGCIEINGGVFEAAKPEWTLNCKDTDYKAGTAKIVVKGGRFKNFDPANNNAEGPGTNFVADGYQSVLEGDYYVVKPI